MQVKKGEIFNSVKVAQLPRNTFDLSHQHVTTMDFANLVPICVLEAIPGDIFNISCETFMRLQPMITPMMHRCDLTVHYFFVPNRILWPGWENFITGNQALDGGLNTPAAPVFTIADIEDENLDGRMSLLNYMGAEVDFAVKLVNAGFDEYTISALPSAAYQKIYWDYYVPRELAQNEFAQYEFQPLDNGINTNVVGLNEVHKKGWGRDYFTSALPYAQKGEAVLIPMEGTVELAPYDVTNPVGPGEFLDTTTRLGYTGSVGTTAGAVEVTHGTVDTVVYDPNGSLTVSNGVTTINDLRRAMRLQEWLEKNARAGTRYSESLRAHFNVISSDARLQRAEYITGVKSPIIVSEVLNTTGTDTLPQGNMSGHGMAIADGQYGNYYCEEHGFIMGIISVTPKAAYSSGLPRFLTKRSDFMDYFWAEFANIGEQEIEQIEIETDFITTGKTPNTTFGYIPRYSEYKFKNDQVTGDFADSSSADLGSLRTWVMQRHYGNGYGATANLNTQFITGDIQQVAAAPFAIQDTPLMVQQINKVRVSRQMPVYGTPSF